MLLLGFILYIRAIYFYRHSDDFVSRPICELCHIYHEESGRNYLETDGDTFLHIPEWHLHDEIQLLQLFPHNVEYNSDGTDHFYGIGIDIDNGHYTGIIDYTGNMRVRIC